MYLADIRTPIATQQRWRKRLLKREFALLKLHGDESNTHNLLNAGESWTCLGVEFLGIVYMEMGDPR